MLVLVLAIRVGITGNHCAKWPLAHQTIFAVIAEIGVVGSAPFTLTLSGASNGEEKYRNGERHKLTNRHNTLNIQTLGQAAALLFSLDGFREQANVRNGAGYRENEGDIHERATDRYQIDPAEVHETER